MKASNAILQAQVSPPVQAPIAAPQAPEPPALVDISERPFFGAQGFSKTYNPKKELPHHRDICIRLARGDTVPEIAAETGWSKVMINYTRQQPWAQELIAQLQGEEGHKIVQATLTGAGLNAAKLIVASIEHSLPGTKGFGKLEGHKVSDSCKDAHKLLDRLYGTAPQTVTVHHTKEDMEQLSTEELENIARGNTN